MKGEVELEKKIWEVFMENGFPYTTTYEKLAWDIRAIGWDKVKKLAESCTPSQLGRMRLLGVRFLAQINRDDPETFNKLINNLDKVLKN